MKFYNVNWSTKRSDSQGRRLSAGAVSGLPSEMDVACDCGHRWHATRGNAKGQINKGVLGEVTCTKCGEVDAFSYPMLQTA